MSKSSTAAKTGKFVPILVKTMQPMMTAKQAEARVEESERPRVDIYGEPVRLNAL